MRRKPLIAVTFFAVLVVPLGAAANPSDAANPPQALDGMSGNPESWVRHSVSHHVDRLAPFVKPWRQDPDWDPAAPPATALYPKRSSSESTPLQGERDCESHPPILIREDEGPLGFVIGHDPTTGDPIYRPGSGVGAGTGTAEDPYVIEGWCITGSPVLLPTEGIRLWDTSAHVAIRSTVVQDHWDAIRLEGASNVVVEDNTITGIGNGVLLEHADDNTIRGNRIQDNAANGIILLDGADGNAILGNTVADNERFGIALWRNSHENTIEGNTVAGNEWDGIAVFGSHRNRVRDNTIEESGWTGLDLIDTLDSVLEGNELAGNDADLWIDSSRNVLMRENTLRGLWVFGDGPVHYVHQIDATNLVNDRPLLYLEGIENEVIDPETVPEPGQVILANARDVTVRGLEIHGVTERAIQVAFSEGVRVTENTLVGNPTGVSLDAGVTGSIVEDNVVRESGLAVEVRSSSGNVVRGNLLVDSGGLGVLVWWGSDENEIHHNTMTGNGFAGVSVFGFFGPSPGNAIHNNTLSDNGLGIGLFTGADATTVRDNAIVDNRVAGVYLEWNSGNAIHNNNLQGNGWQEDRLGILAYNVEETVDARFNWWGCADGPGADGCDAVEGGVEYIPWSTEPNRGPGAE